MAVVDLTKKQSTKQTLNSKVALPRDRYTLRCLKEEYSLAKNSNQPMVTRVFEFITESITMPDGTKLVLAGQELTKYYPLASNGTAKNSPKDATAMCLDNYKQDTDRMGIKTNWSQFDTNKPELKAKGIIVEAICGDEERMERKAPAPGKREGDIIYGLDKKPIIKHQAKLMEVLGVSETKMNVAY